MPPVESQPGDSRERVDVEVKVTFLEQTLEALNEVVIEQGSAIERLEARLARLEALAKEGPGGAQGVSGEDPRTLEDDRPPHY